MPSANGFDRLADILVGLYCADGCAAAAALTQERSFDRQEKAKTRLGVVAHVEQCALDTPGGDLDRLRQVRVERQEMAHAA
ncbi:MAG: hypothetical protein E5Y81_20630, partial [Mesorhizobium sp.]